MTKIFLSSSLIDMQEERKFIKDVFLKQFNKDVSSYSNLYSLTDLASGLSYLSLKDENVHKKITETSLHEIKNSDYFIFFIGDKVDFNINKENDLNLKENIISSVFGDVNEESPFIEFQSKYAEHFHNRDKFIFCFRNLNRKTIPLNLKEDYIETDQEKIRLLNNFKKYIKETYPLQTISYDAYFNKNNELVIDKNFKKRLLSKFKYQTLKVQGILDNKPLLKNKQFIDTVKNGCDTSFYYNKLFQLLWVFDKEAFDSYKDYNSSSVTVLKGRIYDSKTRPLSLFHNSSNEIIIPAYIWPDSIITTIDELLKYLIYTSITQAKKHLPVDHKNYYLILKKLNAYENAYPGATYEELVVYFNETIELIVSFYNKKIYVIIDGIDKLVDEKSIRSLSFIRSFLINDNLNVNSPKPYLGYSFKNNVHFIISTHNDYKFDYYTYKLLNINEYNVLEPDEQINISFKEETISHFKSIIKEFNLNEDLLLILQAVSLMDYGFNIDDLARFCKIYDIDYNELDLKFLIKRSITYFSQKSNVIIDFSHEMIKEALSDIAYNDETLINNLLLFLLNNKHQDDNYLYTVLNIAYKTNKEELLKDLLKDKSNYNNKKFIIQVNNLLVYNDLKDYYLEKDIINNIVNYIGLVDK